MKPSNLFIVLIAGIFFLSCSKDKNTNPDVSQVKIASISGIGDFTYNNDKLASIGNEVFFYTSGRISGSRVYQNDTTLAMMQVVGRVPQYVVSERMERSSYIWENNKVIERRIDTLMSRFKTLDTEQGGLTDNESFSIITNLQADKFFYSNKSIDSLLHYGNTSGEGSLRKQFIYNEAGDIIKIIEFSVTTHSPAFFPLYISNKIETEITYDNRPNPFYHLFKQTGIILNKVKAFNFSPHNPIHVKTTITQYGQTVSISREISYEYNAAGFPVKLYYNNVWGLKDCTISYK